MQRRKDAICMPSNKGKNENTLIIYIVSIAFLWQKWLRERPQCYFVLTLPVLLFLPNRSVANKVTQDLVVCSQALRNSNAFTLKLSK